MNFSTKKELLRKKVRIAMEAIDVAHHAWQKAMISKNPNADKFKYNYDLAIAAYDQAHNDLREEIVRERKNRKL